MPNDQMDFIVVDMPTECVVALARSNNFTNSVISLNQVPEGQQGHSKNNITHEGFLVGITPYSNREFID